MSTGPRSTTARKRETRTSCHPSGRWAKRSRCFEKPSASPPKRAHTRDKEAGSHEPASSFTCRAHGPASGDFSTNSALPADLDLVAAQDQGHEDRVLEHVVKPFLLFHNVALFEFDAFGPEPRPGRIANTTFGRRV